jgi:hypothetical protein
MGSPASTGARNQSEEGAMSLARRTLKKRLLRIAVLAAALATLYVLSLALPTPAFAHREHFGEFTVYSTESLPDDFARIVEEARSRTVVMENARRGERYRVFLCDDTRFRIFAFLTRRNPHSMAIGLSAFGNIFVNQPRVQFIASHNPAGIRHSRFEGNLAEVIAHEIAHFNVVHSIGYRASMHMPVWKSEGYAEYQANLASTNADEAYRFTERVDQLRDDALWENAFARRLFAWHLYVEFLAEVRGFSLADLLDADVTEGAARTEMFAWRDEQRGLD